MDVTNELHHHAPAGGIDILGRHYRGGELLPFYVPRDHMPQVDEHDLPALVAAAVAQNQLSPTFEVAKVHDLRAHQKVDMKRVRAMPDELLLKPILISRDGFVLDGNHRWTAHVLLNAPLTPAIKIGLNFGEAIDWLFTLPFTYAITPETPVRN